MSVIEIIAGATLILSCIIIIVLVTLQSEKGSGLSGAIMGGSGTEARGRGKTNDERLAKFTKVFAFVFFVITLAVNVISLAAK